MEPLQGSKKFRPSLARIPPLSTMEPLRGSKKVPSVATIPPLPPMGPLQGSKRVPVLGIISRLPTMGPLRGSKKALSVARLPPLPTMGHLQGSKKSRPWQELHLSPQWSLYKARRKPHPVAQESRFSCPCPMDKGPGKSSSRSPGQGKRVTGRFDTSWFLRCVNSFPYLA